MDIELLGTMAEIGRWLYPGCGLYSGDGDLPSVKQSALDVTLFLLDL